MKEGKLIVISGPSGVGKGTIKQEILNDPTLNLAFSVSYTTRDPREDEVDGVHYFFVSQKTFDQMVEDDAFLEHAGYVGNSYGTCRKQVEDLLAQGKNVLLEIETNGAGQIIQKRPDALSIFILPPSMEALYERLKGRGTESSEVIEERVEKARQEMTLKDNYKYQVVNDDLKLATSKVRDIILKG